MGIDSSRSMVEEARKLEGDNVRFALQDITEISYGEEFDLIYSNAALHWVKDHNTVLAKCYTALKSNGRLRFNFASQGNCSNFIAVTRELMTSDEFGYLFRGTCKISVLRWQVMVIIGSYPWELGRFAMLLKYC